MVTFGCAFREQKKVQTRYDEWESLRDAAIQNREASGATGPLPKALSAPAPPRPTPVEEDEMTDVSMELQNNIGMDSFASDGLGGGAPFQLESVSFSFFFPSLPPPPFFLIGGEREMRV